MLCGCVQPVAEYLDCPFALWALIDSPRYTRLLETSKTCDKVTDRQFSRKRTCRMFPDCESNWSPAPGRYLASLRSEFDDQSAPSSSGQGSSDAIRCIIWSVQLEFKVRSQSAHRNWTACGEMNGETHRMSTVPSRRLRLE